MLLGKLLNFLYNVFDEGRSEGGVGDAKEGEVENETDKTYIGEGNDS